MELQLDRALFNDAYLSSLAAYDKRYEVYYGGAGSGKSVFVAQKLVIKCLSDRRKILVLRKVGKTVKNSVFQLLLDTLADWKILDRCKVNRTDFSITLPTGSVFLCTGLDDSEKIKSIAGITDIWMEEATEFTLDDFNQLDLRLRHATARNQQIFLSFNPVSKVNYCYNLFFNPDVADDVAAFRAKCMILHTTYKDNRFLPQNYIDSLLLLKGTNPVYYNIYALGEFGSLSKLVFYNWKVAEIDAIEGTTAIGIDFGYTNDPTTIILSIVDDVNKRIYVKEEFFGKGLTNDRIAEQVKRMGLAKSIIIADSAEPKSIEEIKRLGVSRIKAAKKGKDSILQGIQKLQQYEIIINPACTNLIEEFQNYSWEKDKNTNEYINKPIDSWNHGIDALRYSMQCVTAKLRTMDKAALGL